MNKKQTLRLVSLLFFTTTFILLSCEKIPIGYLDVDNAEYVPKVVEVYKQADPESERAQNNAPWTSFPIQGVMGTSPINYKIADVKCEEGGNADVFKKEIDKQTIRLQGSILQIFQSAVSTLPIGKYILTITVFNEGHQKTLPDIITVSVGDIEPSSPSTDEDDYE